MAKLGLIRPSDRKPDGATASAAEPSPAGMPAVQMGLSHATVMGNVTIAYYAAAQADRAAGAPQAMTDTRQTMKAVKAGGSVTQRSAVPAIQDMDDIDAAGDVDQIIMDAGSQPETIAADVRRLRDAVAAFDPRAAAELGRLDAAEAAAQQGDGAGALAQLKGLGRWVGKIASDIGAGALAKIIEARLGP